MPLGAAERAEANPHAYPLSMIRAGGFEVKLGSLPGVEPGVEPGP